jgi:glycogen debranching enzyme
MVEHTAGTRAPTTPARPAPPTAPHQPMLHDLVAVLAAPLTAFGMPDGQIRRHGAQGVYHGDVRVLCQLELRVDDAEPVAVGTSTHGADRALFTGVLRHLGDPVPDLTVRIDRDRRVSADGLVETIRVVSNAAEPVTCTLQLLIASDLAAMDLVKGGHPTRPATPDVVGSTVRWHRATPSGPLDVILDLAADGRPPPAVRVLDDAAVQVDWPITLAPGASAAREVRLRSIRSGVIQPAPRRELWSRPEIEADDRRIGTLLNQSLDDLGGLLATTREEPEAPFVTAGAPWYLTLFGRDSLWTARMLLPLGTDIALGTLTALAARQGTRYDATSQEQPGKIPHEIRDTAANHHGGMALPPCYYGTVDATPLWVCLLHDAWRWGLPENAIRPLLAPLRAALTWLLDDADPDGDGFVEYIDRSGHGLANQGWKDSADAVRFADGTLATAPIALVEVQGYAYRAAHAGADLLEALAGNDAAMRELATRCRHWAERLASRFRDAFWIGAAGDGYPALALDADKRRVDAATSNIGHLLGTGLLDETESATVVRRLTGPAMDSGFGLRTMASTDRGYAPLSYHCGSVWPHDTAIVLHGMARAGLLRHGTGLLEGLLAAGAAFDGRLPELYSGDARREVGRPIAYPAACRPQAWAAGAAVMLLESMLGLRPDVPNGTLTVSPVRPSPVGRIRLSGLRIGSDHITVEVDHDGRLVDLAGSGLAVRNE